MKNICIISFSSIETDRRVKREIFAAMNYFEVTVIGYGNWTPPKNVIFHKLTKTKKISLKQFFYYIFLILGKISPLFYEKAYWVKPEYRKALEILKNNKFDIIHANDWDSLPVSAIGFKYMENKIIFDAHEFTPAQNENNLLIKFFIKPYKEFLLKKYFSKSMKFITVGRYISDLYKDFLGVKESIIILNVADYVRANFHNTSNNLINIIYHGIATPGRNIESIIELLNYLDNRFVINLMLLPGPFIRYYNNLIQKYSKKYEGRLIFHEPVPDNEIISKINAFDIGIPLLIASQKNNYYALPNKFFDYIIAGLCVVVTPLPSMAEFVIKGNIGIISKNFDLYSIAQDINKLTPAEIDRFKRNSLKYAKQMNSKKEMEKLINVYFSVM